MELRELLQVEIWSKRTSRRILVGLKFVAIGLGVVVVGIALWIFVWTHWLTQGERSKGKIALVQVEALQSFDEMSDAEFDARSRQAQEKVNDASDAIFTAKDRQIAVYLSLCLFEMQGMKKSQRIRKILDSRPGFTKSERSKELELKSEESERHLLKTLVKSLHESLDK